MSNANQNTTTSDPAPPLIRVRQSPRRITHAFIDFDGTVSLLRTGWWRIMADVALEQFHEEEAIREANRSRFTDEILKLNGKPPAIQIQRLADMMLDEDGLETSASDMTATFHERLTRELEDRKRGLIEASIPADSFLVHGVTGFLNHLSRNNVQLHLVTGTEQSLAAHELTILGLDGLFGDSVHGPSAEAISFSKQTVFERLMQEHILTPGEVLVVGDGFVEMALAAERGMPCFGIACLESENGSGKVEPDRVRHLTEARADVILPDFRDAIALFESISES